MLYNTKLNEFEPDQLGLLIGIVQEKIDDLNNKIQSLEYLPQGDLRHDLELSFDAEIDTFILWKVQLENAKSDIKEMNKINAG